MKSKITKLELDNYSAGLLIGIISRTFSSDKSLTEYDIEKLKEIKTQLQDTQK